MVESKEEARLAEVLHGRLPRVLDVRSNVAW